MDLSTLVRFSRLVSDSETSEGVSSLLAQTVVDRCVAAHALVFGMGDDSEFSLQSSYGTLESEMTGLKLTGVESIAELGDTIGSFFNNRGYAFRSMPLISNARLFGILGVLFPDSRAISAAGWDFIESLVEMTAISLNKTFQHQRLQQAYDNLQASQAALVRTEKFRALGQMSAGIAHDLKNLLNPIQLYTDHLRDVADSPAEVREALDRIERVLNRGLETVDRLRDFSRLSPEDSDDAATDLPAMVHEAIEISKAKLGRADLALDLAPTPAVLLRAADCVTAIVNLIFNAADAVQGRGRIVVRTGSSEDFAWIEVEDDGPGIPPEIRHKILEPLFTTKGDQGTGLGVPIVYAFTQRHGGRLDIESEGGQGARFRMSFPIP